MARTIGREAFESLLRHKVTPSELKKIMRAYRFAKHAHRGQKRDDGERYIEHPKEATRILFQEFGVYDAEMISAELLHDVPEDTYFLGGEQDADWDALTDNFGERVAYLVRAVTKSKSCATQEQKREYAEAIANGHDEDVQILKLADRLHNLRTLEACDREKQRRVLQESLEVYLPCAKRIGGAVYEQFFAQCAYLQEKYFPEFAHLLQQ